MGTYSSLRNQIPFLHSMTVRLKIPQHWTKGVHPSLNEFLKPKSRNYDHDEETTVGSVALQKLSPRPGRNLAKCQLGEERG